LPANQQLDRQRQPLIHPSDSAGSAQRTSGIVPAPPARRRGDRSAQRYPRGVATPRAAAPCQLARGRNSGPGICDVIWITETG
jgi:hypothetical protein